jgi:hypothetical protein
VWDPHANVDPTTNDQHNGFLGSVHRPWMDSANPEKEPIKHEELGSSDEEILWKRAPTMSRWRRPKRRGHQDAFGSEGDDRTDGGNLHGGRKKITRSGSSSGPGGVSGAGSGADTSG